MRPELSNRERDIRSWRDAFGTGRANLPWVHWWNTARLHSSIGNVPPEESETAHDARRQPAPRNPGQVTASTEPGRFATVRTPANSTLGLRQTGRVRILGSGRKMYHGGLRTALGDTAYIAFRQERSVEEAAQCRS